MIREDSRLFFQALELLYDLRAGSFSNLLLVLISSLLCDKRDEGFTRRLCKDVFMTFGHFGNSATVPIEMMVLLNYLSLLLLINETEVLTLHSSFVSTANANNIVGPRRLQSVHLVAIYPMATLLHRLHSQIRTPPDESGSPTPNTTEEGTGTYAHSGPLGYRLIGVVIVLTLALLASILWVTFAKWPRRKLRSWGCTCLPAPPEKTNDGGEKYAGNSDGSESWVISHGMEAHRMGGVGSDRTKHISQEGAEEADEIHKGKLQP
ncbi:hypothetical protein J3R30DRAFT_3401833 [Lentinula aciculospora]|uniref:Uncharacterized protein n=1 Tax=Lentinula aciculospora TaxID=153920 RepID=A0A9W9DVH8_9AGAR|nr:hypothetical protein J3R30DRAFT_3401833 [Lentinula aciculospora]